MRFSVGARVSFQIGDRVRYKHYGAIRGDLSGTVVIVWNHGYGDLYRVTFDLPEMSGFNGVDLVAGQLEREDPLQALAATGHQ